MTMRSPGARARFQMPSLSVLMSLLLVTVMSCSEGAPDATVDEEYLLGTIIRVTLYADNASDLLEALFDRVTDIEAKMSTSENDYERTELLDVNRSPAGTAVAVSPDTLEVLREALRFSRLSDGAFDVTIWPLVKLWGIGSGNETVPSENLIQNARSLVDHRRLSLNDNGTVTLSDEGMGLDVGAIAKGYAADEAARILKSGGVDHALLDFGGNILVIGDKPDGTAWRIGVQRPDANRSQYIGIVSAVDRTVVTSGPYERFFVKDGVRYHHILDPWTGYPSRNGLEQVTIVSERSIDADALSTAGYVLGLENAWKLVESLDGVEAIFATEDLHVYVTRGLTDPDGAAYFRKTDEEYTLMEGAPGAE